MILFVESGGWFHSFEGYINWICSADSCTLCIAASAVTVNCNAQGQLEPQAWEEAQPSKLTGLMG